MEQKNNVPNAAARTVSPNGSSLKPSAAPFVPSFTPKPFKVTASSFEPGKPYGSPSYGQQSYSGSYYSPNYSQPYGGSMQRGGLWIPPTNTASPDPTQQAQTIKTESQIPKEKNPLPVKVNKAIEIVDPTTKQPISLNNKAIEIVDPTTNQPINIRNSNNAVTKSETETIGENTKVPENENPKVNDKEPNSSEKKEEEDKKSLDKQENNTVNTETTIKSQEENKDKESPPTTKRTYSFDFLMSYKDNNKSTPEGMLIVDDLDPTKITNTPKKNFTPKNPNAGQWSHKKKIHTPIVIPHSENAWTRPKDTEDEFVKFGRKVKNILNKLTIENFDDFCEKLEEMDLTSTESKELMVNNVFEMAITQPNFAYMYALLCQRLAQSKESNLEKEFRRLLVMRCQKEFEGREKPPVIGPEITNLEERYDLEEKSEKIRLKNLGTTKFIGELFRLKLITEKIMQHCLSKLLGMNDKNSNDDDLDHFVLLMNTIGKILDAKPGNLDRYFDYMKTLATNNDISYRIRCLLKNLDELRNNKWVPRRESETPKTIQEVHEAAAKEEQERQFRERQLEKKLGRNPPPKAKPAQKQKKVDADGWQEVTTTNKKAKSAAATKQATKPAAKPAAKDVQNRFNILESNEANKLQQQANKNTNNKNQRKDKNPTGQQEEVAPKRPEYTLIQFEDKVDVILNEYLDSEDAAIAIKCVEELQHPQFHNRVIEMTISKAIEACTQKETAMITKLIGAFAKETNLFKTDLFTQAFNEIISLYDDIVIDVPKASMGLGYCLAHALLDKYLPYSYLQKENFSPVTTPYEPEKIVAACFKELLAEDEKEAINIHKESKLGDFGQILKDGSTEENIKKFVASNNLENLFNPKSN